MEEVVFMKKKILMGVLTAAICGSALVGCTGKTTQETTTTQEMTTVESTSVTAQTTEAETMADSDKIDIITTIFPSYDWVKEIVGDQADRFNLVLLSENGSDLHNYQPTAEDMTKIASCDLFIYVGGESDMWVPDALKVATNKNMKVINLLEEIGDSAVEEEIVEGMEAEDHDHDHEDHDHENHEDHEEHDHEDHDHDEVVYDEHIWLSLKNAKTLVKEIAEDIIELDSSHETVYRENLAMYQEELDMLDSAYQSAIDGASKKAVVFGDRFPFRYLVDDYGLSYSAAFVGCSAETEASFETITFLSKKVDELGVNYIFTIENSDQKIANTIKENTMNKDQKIVILNSLQSVNKEDILKGASYLGAMTENLTVLQTALE